MLGSFKKLTQAATAIGAAFAATDVVQAQAQTPAISGDSWVAIAIVLGLVVLIFLLIGGVVSISRRDKKDGGDGIAIIGAEEDDDK